MKTIQSCLLIASSLMSASSFAAGPVSEKNIFEALARVGVYIQGTITSPSEYPGTGEFRLNRIQCSRDLSFHMAEFECNFVDERRPFEEVSFVGVSAETIFQNLLDEGVPTFIEPFTHGKKTLMNVENLRCSKSGFIETELYYKCFLMKRLVDTANN